MSRDVVTSVPLPTCRGTGLRKPGPLFTSHPVAVTSRGSRPHSWALLHLTLCPALVSFLTHKTFIIDVIFLYITRTHHRQTPKILMPFHGVFILVSALFFSCTNLLREATLWRLGVIGNDLGLWALHSEST